MSADGYHVSLFVLGEGARCIPYLLRHSQYAVTVLLTHGTDEDVGACDGVSLKAGDDIVVLEQMRVTRRLVHDGHYGRGHG